MRYPLGLLAASVIVGAVGHANHIELLAELATLGVLISLVAAGHNAWTMWRGRHNSQRD